ncbi:MAG: TIGR04211 family SH3 domain-containing protein, partial [Ketobacter sp.]
MKQLISAFATLIIASLLAIPGYAKTIYIHDNLRVDMRTGPSVEYRIIDFLRSGTSMEVLKESGEWIMIRTDGKEGWIQSQYTTEEPIARDQLARALKQIQSLQSENSSLKSQLSETRSELGGLKSDHNKMSNSTEKLQQ